MLWRRYFMTSHAVSPAGSTLCLQRREAIFPRRNHPIFKVNQTKHNVIVTHELTLARLVRNKEVMVESVFVNYTINIPRHLPANTRQTYPAKLAPLATSFGTGPVFCDDIPEATVRDDWAFQMYGSGFETLRTFHRKIRE